MTAEQVSGSSSMKAIVWVRKVSQILIYFPSKSIVDDLTPRRLAPLTVYAVSGLCTWVLERSSRRTYPSLCYLP